METRGGKREGAGRKKGVPNKDKRGFIELITDEDVEECLTVLRKARKSKNENIRVNSAIYLLDQRYGKARQRTELGIDKSFEDWLKHEEHV